MNEDFLLITVKPNKEQQAIYEIGDALFPYDNQVKPEKTSYPGVIIIHTKLPVTKAYTILLNQTLAYPQKIYPLTTNITKILNNIPPKAKIYLQCEHRGQQEKCKQHIQNTLKKIPQKNTTKTKKQSTHTLHIQAINNKTGYTLLPTNCENYQKTLQNKKLKQQCTKHINKTHKQQ